LGLRISKAQNHDLGKLLFAFSCFWAYIWLSQFLFPDQPFNIPEIVKSSDSMDKVKKKNGQERLTTYCDTEILIIKVETRTHLKKRGVF